MYRFLFFSLLAITFNNIFSQNIVPNGDFENISKNPVATKFKPGGLRNTTNWSSSNSHLGIEYYNSEIKTDINKVNWNNSKFNGSAEAFSRNAFIGYYLQVNNSRRYLQVRLTTPLTKDTKYKFSFYVSPGEKMSSHYTSSIQALFSKTLTKNKSERIIQSPQISNDTSNFIQTKGEWQRIQGVFTAKGGEEYLTIGNFSSARETRTKTNSTNIKTDNAKTIFIYIDNVVLEKVIPFKEKVKLNDTLILERLLFTSGTAKIQKSTTNELNTLVSFLKNNSTKKLTIIGHTDNIGNNELNQKLSQQRTESVKGYLISKGIKENRITCLGKGDSEPIESNKTSSGRKNNRRVEIIINN